MSVRKYDEPVQLQAAAAQFFFFSTTSCLFYILLALLKYENVCKSGRSDLSKKATRKNNNTRSEPEGRGWIHISPNIV